MGNTFFKRFMISLNKMFFNSMVLDEGICGKEVCSKVVAVTGRWGANTLRVIALLVLVGLGVNGWGQATLPVSRTNWNGANPTGWTHTGTSDRTTNFACTGNNSETFDNSNDRIVLFINAAPGTLIFKLKMASMSGASSLLVEQSPDGTTYTQIGRYGTASGATAITDCGNISIALTAGSRYIRWTYTKGSGNVDIDDVSVAAAAAVNLNQANFTSVLTPLHMASGDATRLPLMFRATVSGLSAITTYRYFSQGALSTDFGGTNPGAGNSLLISSSGVYKYTTGPSLSNAADYETFTTDASGIYTGWFGFVHTGNARFTAGNTIYPTLEIGTGSTAQFRIALDVGITVLGFSNSSGLNNGTFIRGASSATPNNLVAIYDNTAGTGRPLAITPVEDISAAFGGAITGYNTANGAWNTIMPNLVAGVKNISQYSVSTGALLPCVATDADGVWPTGSVNTGGSFSGTSAKVISSTDAPLANCPSLSVTPTSIAGLTYVIGAGPSTSVQLTNITAVNLSPTSGNIVVTPALGASSNFEVSLSSSSGFAQSINYVYTAASFNTINPTIYVRLKASLGVNTYGPETMNVNGGGGSAIFTVAGSVTSGGCNQLMISEYHEGTGNEKYIELFNPTNAAINLANYRLAHYNNGAGSPTYTLSLSGSLPAYTTYIIANNLATAYSTPNLSTSSSVMGFNGNDVIALQTSGGTNIDVIGTIGSSANFAVDVDLVRNSNITLPVTTYNASQWTITTANNVSNLGAHNSSCIITTPCMEPTVPTNVAVSRNGTSPTVQIDGTITAPGSNVPSHYLVVRHTSATLSSSPVDAVAYNIGDALGGGVVVDNVTTTSFVASSLTPGITYYFFVFGYNNNSCSGGPNYNTASVTANATTQPNNGTITEGCTGATTHTISWAAPVTGGSDGVVIMARQGGTPTTPGSDFNSLTTASTDFVTAGTIGNSKLIYKGNAAGAASLTVTNLANGLNYTIRAYTYKNATSTTYSTGTSASQTIAFGDVSNASGASGNNQAGISWTNPPGACFDQIMVVASTGSISALPSGDGSAYTANANFGGSGTVFGGGKVVYENNGSNVTVTGLTNGSTYYFKIFVRQGSTWSAGVQITVVPNGTTVFKAGELFFCGFDIQYEGTSSSEDMYLVATLVPIKTGTQFSIANSRYEAGDLANLRSGKWGGSSTTANESPAVVQIEYTGAADITAGSVLRINLSSATDGVGSIFVNGTDRTAEFTTSLPFGYALGPPNIAQSAPDQIFIVQGTFASDGIEATGKASYILTGRVLFGMTIGTEWVATNQACSGGSGSADRESRLPFELTCFNIERTSQAYYGYYKNNQLHNGTIRQILGDVKNTASSTYWTFSTSGTNNLDFTINYTSTTSTHGGLTYNVIPGNPAGTWIGDVSTNWFDCSNWHGLAVPDANEDVYVGASSIGDVLIDDAATYASEYNYIAKAKSISISDGKLLYFSNNGSDALEVSGSTILTTGLLDAKSASISIAGDLLVESGSILYPGTSTLLFNGSALQNISNVAANIPLTNNIIIDGFGVSLSGDVNIASDLTLSNGTLAINSQTLYLNGSIFRTNGTITTTTNSSLIFGPNASALTLPNNVFSANPATLNNLSLNRVGGLSLGNQGISMVGNLAFSNGILNNTNITTNILTLTTTATTTGGSNNSFVNGPMQKDVNASTPDFAFPVGKGTSYQPVTIAETNAMGTFRAEYFPTGATTTPRNSILGPIFFGVWANKYWDVTRVSGTSAARVGLPYITFGDSWFQASPTAGANVAVAHYVIGGWQETLASGNFNNVGPGYIEAIVNTGTGTVYSDLLTSFSPFTIGWGSPGVLPLQFTRFTVQNRNNSSLLEWTVADAISEDYFEIEYGTTPSQFVKVGKLFAHQGSQYQFTHLPATAPNHYYRIKAMLKSGGVMYSKVEKLSSGEKDTYIYGMVQNPVMQQDARVKVYSRKTQNIRMQLFDMLGRLLLRKSGNLMPGENIVAMSTSLLAAGMYRLSVTTDDGTQSNISFIK